MITVVSGTNRKNSECLQFSIAYAQILGELTREEVKLLPLEDIPHDWFHPLMYDQQSPSLEALQDEFVLPADKMVMLTPEYNGGFPGVLKLFLDACSVREYKASFSGKKVALVGIATGRAGNLRGMEHLTGILNHVGMVVMPNKLPISSIGKLGGLDGGPLADQVTRSVMEAHAKELLDF